MFTEGSASFVKQLIQWMRVFFSGMCMGAADIVPGISGGTVAFIIGVYPQLIESLKSINMSSLKMLVSFQYRNFSCNLQWKFLLTLVAGITVSFVTLAPYFKEILGHELYRVYLYSTFIGLILASVCFCARQIKQWKWSHYFSLACGALIAFVLTGSEFGKITDEPLYDVSIVIETSRKVENYSDGWLTDVPSSSLSAMIAKDIIVPETIVKNQNESRLGQAKEFVYKGGAHGFDLWMIFCGAIAISAMLLPGISGSYLLTVLGVYGSVIAALADFVQGIKIGVFEKDAFFLLASMLTGIVLGAIIFSRVVSWTLRNYHDGTIASLTGFMLGALGSVWPFWTYQYTLQPLKLTSGPQLEIVRPIFPDLSSPVFIKASAFALAGFLLVFLLEWVAGKPKKLREQN